MTKRAPGRASAALRLRRVGAALARRSARAAPASRTAGSARFRSRMAPSTSAIAELDQVLELAVGGAGADDPEGFLDAFAKAFRLARGEQKGAGVQRRRLLLRR